RSRSRFAGMARGPRRRPVGFLFARLGGGARPGRRGARAAGPGPRAPGVRAVSKKPLRALRELHADEPDVAAGYLERLAQMEPFDGGVQRDLLSLWVRQGRISRAVRHYQAFQQRLLREFGGGPEFSLSEIVLAS